MLITWSCGLVLTYVLVNEQIYPFERVSEGYSKGFDPHRGEIKKCRTWKKDEIDSRIDSAWKTIGLMEGMFFVFAIGRNICLLILTSWRYSKRRKK